MRVKRYLVDTMPEAMLQIRGDLGTDAVILSTKEVKVGGFMGMFSKRKLKWLLQLRSSNLKSLGGLNARHTSLPGLLRL